MEGDINMRTFQVKVNGVSYQVEVEETAGGFAPAPQAAPAAPAPVPAAAPAAPAAPQGAPVSNIDSPVGAPVPNGNSFSGAPAEDDRGRRGLFGR